MTLGSKDNFIRVPQVADALGVPKTSVWNFRGGLTPQVKNRATELAEWLVKNPEHRAGGSKEGLFGIHIVNDMYRGFVKDMKRIQNAEFSYDFIAQNIIDGSREIAEKESGDITVGDAKELGLILLMNLRANYPS